MTGRVQSIQVALPRWETADCSPAPAQRPWRSGIFKVLVPGPLRLGWYNLQGDGQADMVHHGGVDKAVCAYSIEHWRHWQPILPPDQSRAGAFGENFTVERLTETEVCIGDVFSIGTAVVQISQPRQPCWKLARRWRMKNLALQVEQTGFTGWYFRVLREGEVAAHQWLQLLDRPHPEWTVAAANRIMHHERNDRDAAERLSQCPALSSSWRQIMEQRALSQVEPAPERRQFGNAHADGHASMEGL
jgi:MOSC domain-containing protein YiiM